MSGERAAKQGKRVLVISLVALLSFNVCWGQSAQELSPEELKQKRRELERRLEEVQKRKEGLLQAQDQTVAKFSSRPTEANGEPRGISLAKGEESTYLRWEAPKWVAQRLVGHLICSGSPQELCIIFEGWTADFGVEGLVDETRLQFYDSKLYAYSVTFASASFSTVLDILSKPLGEPDRSAGGEVQNAMGATFDQQEVSWNKPTTGILLRKRASKVTEGLLLIVYKPLQAQIPEERGHAPF